MFVDDDGDAMLSTALLMLRHQLALCDRMVFGMLPIIFLQNVASRKKRNYYHGRGFRERTMMDFC